MRRLHTLAVLLAAGFAAAAVAQNATPATPATPAKPADPAKPASPAAAQDTHAKDSKHADKGAKHDEKKETKDAKKEGKAAEPVLIPAGAQAPDWTLKDAAGKEHRLADFKGKVIVMDFWATWCGPCKKAMPTVQKLHEKFKDKGVVVIGVSTWERDGDPAAYMKEKGFTYNLFLKGDDVAKQYGVGGIPAFFVIGGDGKVVFSEKGFDASDEKKLEKIIEAHLASGKA